MNTKYYSHPRPSSQFFDTDKNFIKLLSCRADTPIPDFFKEVGFSCSLKQFFLILQDQDPKKIEKIKNFVKKGTSPADRMNRYSHLERRLCSLKNLLIQNNLPNQTKNITILIENLKKSLRAPHNTNLYDDE